MERSIGVCIAATCGASGDYHTLRVFWREEGDIWRHDSGLADCDVGPCIASILPHE